MNQKKTLGKKIQKGQKKKLGLEFNPKIFSMKKFFSSIRKTGRLLNLFLKQVYTASIKKQITRDVRKGTYFLYKTFCLKKK